MSDIAICYITDVNFLGQALSAAKQVRSYVNSETASIFCIVIGIDQDVIDRLKPTAGNYQIQFLHLSESEISQFDVSKFRKGSITLASLGRFFIDGLLPSKYKHIIYLDADTWCLRDPTEFVTSTVPEGRFAAVEDAVLSLTATEEGNWGEFVRNYQRKLGLDSGGSYFNAGIFATSRKTLRQLSEEALRFFYEHTELCHHHDQSALNAIIGDRRIALSSRWNFQTALRDLDVEKQTQPSIYHFTEYPKAWMGQMVPWRSIYSDLIREAKDWGGLLPPKKEVTLEDIKSYNTKKQLSRLKLKTVQIGRYISRRQKFAENELNAWLSN